MSSRLETLYNDSVKAALFKELGLENINEVPKITKVTLNMGVGEGIGDKKQVENAVADLEATAGQKVVVTKARKSIAGFKVREGWPIGCKVTLRRDRMWEFLDRLVDILVSVTSVVSILSRLMVVVTTAWVLKSRLFSLKSITIKWINYVV